MGWHVYLLTERNCFVEIMYIGTSLTIQLASGSDYPAKHDASHALMNLKIKSMTVIVKTAIKYGVIKKHWMPLASAIVAHCAQDHHDLIVKNLVDFEREMLHTEAVRIICLIFKRLRIVENSCVKQNDSIRFNETI